MDPLVKPLRGRAAQLGAGELFALMDATLSAIKQVNVEVGEHLETLARARADQGHAPFQTLSDPVRTATLKVICSVVEQIVDGLAFFLLIWGALQTGSVLLAGGVRLMVSLNTWNSRRQKHVSPWRLVDGSPERRSGARLSSQIERLASAQPATLLALANLLARYATAAGFPLTHKGAD